MEERYLATSQILFYPDMSNVNKNLSTHLCSKSFADYGML